MKCPVELSNKAEVRLHRLFADLLTPDKAKGADTQPLRFNSVGMTGPFGCIKFNFNLLIFNGAYLYY